MPHRKRRPDDACLESTLTVPMPTMIPLSRLYRPGFRSGPGMPQSRPRRCRAVPVDEDPVDLGGPRLQEPRPLLCRGRDRAGPDSGCRSSREQAMITLKETGAVAIAATTFARIFFRNAVNIGSLVLECEASCQERKAARFDLEEGRIEAGTICHSLPKDAGDPTSGGPCPLSQRRPRMI